MQVKKKSGFATAQIADKQKRSITNVKRRKSCQNQ